MADKSGKTGGVGLMLATGGDFQPQGDATTTEDGTPTRRFLKDMLRVGVYTHPVFGWELDVTRERLDRFVAAFNRMQGNGIDVEVPVDHSFEAEDNRGYVTSMYRDGDTLYGVHEMRGEQAIALAGMNKNVSVWIEPDYTDGEANAYGEAIIHSSIVQQPVVPGQGEFVPLAASAATAPPTVLVLSQKGDDDMELQEFVNKLRELMGAGDDLTVENALSRIGERFEANAAKVADLGKQVTDLQAKVEQGKAASSAPTMDPDLAETLGTTADRELAMLVEKGNITPAVKKRLSAALVGEQGKRNVRALSVKGGGSVANAVIDALRDNDPAKLGEHTGSQHGRALSRNVPDGEGNTYGSEEQAKAMGDLAYGG